MSARTAKQADFTFLPRFSKNGREIETEKEKLELSFQAKDVEIEKEKCFEMEEGWEAPNCQLASRPY